jgi:Rho-binding antiterminator
MTPADYVPIDCGYHDRLLDLATRRRECEVVYRDESGAERAARGRIEDVYSRGRAEYLRLSGGETIRLDRLRLVDGHAPPPA